MDKINRIKELINILIPACVAYYKYDKPIMSDKEYDSLYLELEQLESETGYIQSNSPTQKVQGEVLDFLVKVQHTEPMLSADKSKDINDVVKFMNKKECVVSWKLDGLTLVLRYNNGKLNQAITRGGGDFGEDVTHSAKMFSNIPLVVDYKGYLEIRGEALITFKEFERINQELATNDESTYASPRNLAAGTVRQLDANITKSRNPIFIAFGIVKCDKDFDLKQDQMQFLYEQGFQIVERSLVYNEESLRDCIDMFKTYVDKLEYLTDGLIIEFNDIKYGKAQGSTGHHSKSLYAFKYNDDTYPTTFKDVELNTTRTGMVSIIGIFNEVDIDGVKVARASLHNYDIFEELQLGYGDIIQVYRANSVIPQIYENETRSGTCEIKMICPSCGEKIVIKRPKIARFLFCENIHCPAQLTDKVSHAVGNDALNIVGLSSATIEKFIEQGFIKEIADIYLLEQHKSGIVRLEGMGVRSYNKLIDSINKSKDTEMFRVLYSMGIKNIGRTASKSISKYFNNDIYSFIKALDNKFDFTKLEDFGETTNDSLYCWWNTSKHDLLNILKYVNIKKPELKQNNLFTDLSGKTFVVTGSIESFKNRKELEDLIISLNGKLLGSVSSKTNYLINNDTTSTSGKNQKAKELNIPIINETDFNKMIGRN